MDNIKIGDKVEGMMNQPDGNEEWYKGVYVKESESYIATHGIFTEAHNETRYFTSMRALPKDPSEFTQTEMRS